MRTVRFPSRLYIRVTVVADMALETPSSDPEMDPPHLMEPPAEAELIAPVAVARLNIMKPGSFISDLLRHSMLKVGSLILNEMPMSFALMLVILGSAPAKLSYVTSHGKVSLRIVAPPLEHLLTFPAVIEPVSSSGVLFTDLL